MTLTVVYANSPDAFAETLGTVRHNPRVLSRIVSQASAVVPGLKLPLLAFYDLGGSGVQRYRFLESAEGGGVGGPLPDDPFEQAVLIQRAMNGDPCLHMGFNARPASGTLHLPGAPRLVEAYEWLSRSHTIRTYELDVSPIQ